MWKFANNDAADARHGASWLGCGCRISAMGIGHVDTPCTPSRVRQAIANAGAHVAKPSP
jgi:hypothetical protein